MTYARRATKPDVPQILAIARRFHAESPLHSRYPFDEPKVIALVEMAMDSLDWLPLVAVNDDEIVGIALLFLFPMFFSDTLEAGDLAFYVAPDRRGTMAAMAMLDEIATWTMHKGVKRLTIGINTGINHDKALSFFLKCGFQVGGMQVYKSFS